MPLPVIAASVIPAALKGAKTVGGALLSKLRKGGGLPADKQASPDGRSRNEILEELRSIRALLGGPRMYFYADDSLFDDGLFYDFSRGRRRSPGPKRIKGPGLFEKIRKIQKTIYEKGKERWREKRRRKEEMSRMSVPQVLEFEKKRKKVRDNLRKLKINLFALDKRVKLMPLSRQSKTVIRMRIDELRKEAKDIERRLKGEGFADEAKVEMSVGQGLAALDTYNNRILEIQRKVEEINDVLIGKRSPQDNPDLVRIAVQTGIINPTRTDSEQPETVPETLPERTPSVPAPSMPSSAATGQEIDVGGWKIPVWLPLVVAGALMLGGKRR